MADENSGAAGAATAPAWYGADASAEIKGYVENKGWDSPLKAIDGYRHLEQLMGADKAGRGVIWPKDEADADGWNAIYTRLGRPEKADGYKIPVPEGQGDAFAKTLLPVFHQLGFSQRQAEGLAKFWNEYGAGEQQRLDAAVAEALAKDQAALKTEWGGACEQNTALVSRTAKALGLSVDDLADMQAAVGFGKVQKMLAGIGERIGEDRLLTGGQSTQRQLTPEAARQRLDELKLDDKWVEKLLNGDAATRAEKDRLDRAMLGIAA